MTKGLLTTHDLWISVRDVWPNPFSGFKIQSREEKKPKQFLTLGLKLPHRSSPSVQKTNGQTLVQCKAVYLTNFMYTLQYVG